MEQPDMDRAAQEAEQELQQVLQTSELARLLSWYQRWYQQAGHKRLGRMLAQAGKALVELGS